MQNDGPIINGLDLPKRMIYVGTNFLLFSSSIGLLEIIFERLNFIGWALVWIFVGWGRWGCWLKLGNSWWGPLSDHFQTNTSACSLLSRCTIPVLSFQKRTTTCSNHLLTNARTWYSISGHLVSSWGGCMICDDNTLFMAFFILHCLPQTQPLPMPLL